MPFFQHVGELVAEAVHFVHPDGMGESRRSVEPGEVVEAAANPDPAKFAEVPAEVPEETVAPAAPAEPAAEVPEQ